MDTNELSLGFCLAGSGVEKKSRWPENSSIPPDLISVWKGSLERLTAGNCISINNFFLFSKETFSIVLPVSEACPAAPPAPFPEPHCRCPTYSRSLIPSANSARAPVWWGGGRGCRGCCGCAPRAGEHPAEPCNAPPWQLHPPEAPRRAGSLGLCGSLGNNANMISDRRMDLCSF